MFLLQHSILYNIIRYFFTALIILMIARWILTLFRLNEGNPIMLFLIRCTEPLVAPIRKRLPRMPYFDVSWIFLWVALMTMQALLLQALPPGW